MRNQLFDIQEVDAFIICLIKPFMISHIISLLEDLLIKAFEYVKLFMTLCTR